MIAGTGGAVNPIFNVTTPAMPAIPQPTINELELTFDKGTDLQKDELRRW